MKALKTVAAAAQDYKFVDPVTKRIEPKQAYCEVVGDSIICSGVYKQ